MTPAVLLGIHAATLEAAADARASALAGAQGEFEAVADDISAYRPSAKFWDMICNG